MSALLPKNPSKGLPEGATRYYVPQTCPISGEDRRRACLELLDGNRRSEVPCRLVGGQHRRPTLHLTMDMGAATWYGGVWLMVGLGLRGTISWDRCHRLVNDVTDAISEAGLTIIRLEMINYLNLRRGPFAKEGNHEVLKAGAKEMFRLLSSDSMLFAIFYEDICDGIGLRHPNQGCPEHCEEA